ncbi:MAG: hypothetical protein IJ933_00615 [Bacteroidales bacterium]|nr:hypothetical protein [Bacteroidales bacterium]
MINIENIIDREMKARGIDNFTTEREWVDVSAPTVFKRLNKYIYMFASHALDAKDEEQKVELISFDNYYNFTPKSLEKSQVSMYQFFEGELTIKTSQYDNTNNGIFVPYRLEFIRIIPIY